MINLEEFPKCIVCGIKGEELYTDLKDRVFGIEQRFNFKRCAVCGLIWLDPRPKTEDIYKCYTNYFHTERHETESGLGGKPLALLKGFLRKNVFCGHYGYRHLHKRHLFCGFGHLLANIPVLGSRIIYDLGERFAYFNPGGLIIDVGCGKGEYLQIMQEIGWNVLGIELDPISAGLSEKKGVPVLRGTFPEVMIEDSVADQVTMYHVIEHLPDPISAIEKCFRILKVGGRLILNMPNAGSLGHSIFNKNWVPLDPPRHFFTFSAKSISAIFGKSSFKNFRIKTLPKTAKYVYDKSVSIRKKGIVDFGDAASQDGWRGFVLKELLLCRLGRERGEEIQVVAVK